MSIEAVETFREKIDTSPELQGALRARVSRNGLIDPETIVGLARDNGFVFTSAELEKAFADKDELSDIELELVSAAGLCFSAGGGG
jgi:predicted ribosomally synthesized peptide with nif11-like leader